MCIIHRLLIISTFVTLYACTSSEEPTSKPTATADTPKLSQQAPPSPPKVDSTPIDTTPMPSKMQRPTRTPPKMHFDAITYHFDTITAGDTLKYAFDFTNVGERPLSIKKVVGSCGCTAASYPFLDIAPKESNSIKARFDSKGKEGDQVKTITISTNAQPAQYTLTLKGYVKPKD